MHTENAFTHREALQVIGNAELAELKALSNVPGVLHLMGHAAILVIAGYAVLHFHGVAWWAATVALGIALVFLFTPLHESIHGTAFRSPYLNTIVADVAGFFILLPPRDFRFFHFAHHRYTQDPKKDPELMTPKPNGLLEYARYLSGIPYWTVQVKRLLNNAQGRMEHFYVPPSGSGKVKRESQVYLAAYALMGVTAIVFRLDVIAWLWLLPVLVGQPFLRAYLLAEHAACPLVADMLSNTRTTFTNRFLRYLAWNMPHHTAHHALPTVPFHHLPQLTALLGSRLKITASGYIEAHRQIRGSWRG